MTGQGSKGAERRLGDAPQPAGVGRADIVMKSRAHDGVKNVAGPWMLPLSSLEPLAGVASPCGVVGL